MKSRKIIAIVFIALALVLGAIFLLQIEFPSGLEAYFKSAYYNQFGPLAISIELLIAGVYLLIGHSKANFALAIFGFTAILDPFFDLINLFSSAVPAYATILLLACAILSLWLAFSNPYKLERISFAGALFSFILGNAVELFFNYL